jgi:cobalt/nickel transport system permease protein
LRKIDYERVPQIGVLSAVFFVASLIHVPLGPTSVHLVLNGLLGLVLGWAAFPAVLVGLTLQAVFFSFGGPTSLGVNTIIMATPAVLCYYLFSGMVRQGNESQAFFAGFAAGAFAILLGAAMTAATLFLAGGAFEMFSKAILAVHLPTAAIEGLITGSAVVFLRKVRPELLTAPLLAPVPSEVCDG